MRFQTKAKTARKYAKKITGCKNTLLPRIFAACMII